MRITANISNINKYDSSTGSQVFASNKYYYSFLLNCVKKSGIETSGIYHSEKGEASVS